MSKIKVNEVTNLGMDGPVYFPDGLIGDGSQMILAPGVETFSPTNLSVNNALDSVIQIGYNQPIVFSGIGTITIREGSESGTIHEEFTCGVSTRATIAGNVLTIDPATDYNFGETYFVSIPSPGIANTSGGFASSITGYQFTTRPADYEGQGGDYVFTAYDSSSPTNYYKYHIFANPGIYTSASPSQNADGFAMMLIGGGGAGGGGFNPSTSLPTVYYANYAGGGAGGLIQYTSGVQANIPSGSHPIVVGTGGSSVDSKDNFNSGVQPRGRETPTGGSGHNTVMTLSPTVSLVALGGGSGGNAYSPSQNDPYHPPTAQPTYYKFEGYPGGSGGGAAGNTSEPATISRGLGVPGQGNPGGSYRYFQSPPAPPNPAYNRHYGPNNTVHAAGGGGGAGSSGGSGLNYFVRDSNYVYSVGRSGQGGNGLSVPAFPGPTIMPRIPVGPQIIPRMQGSYYAGGGAGSGNGNTLPYMRGLQNLGGYGGGGAPTYSPWRPTDPRPGAPSVPPQGTPANGSHLLGGGGAGGWWRASNWPQRNSYPIDTHPSQRQYAPSFAGNGGSGSVMIKYAHPGL